jgi:hypothetical protein
MPDQLPPQLNTQPSFIPMPDHQYLFGLPSFDTKQYHLIHHNTTTPVPNEFHFHSGSRWEHTAESSQSTPTVAFGPFLPPFNQHAHIKRNAGRHQALQYIHCTVRNWILLTNNFTVPKTAHRDDLVFLAHTSKKE